MAVVVELVAAEAVALMVEAAVPTVVGAVVVDIANQQPSQ